MFHKVHFQSSPLTKAFSTLTRHGGGESDSADAPRQSECIKRQTCSNDSEKSQQDLPQQSQQPQRQEEIEQLEEQELQKLQE